MKQTYFSSLDTKKSLDKKKRKESSDIQGGGGCIKRQKCLSIDTSTSRKSIQNELQKIQDGVASPIEVYDKVQATLIRSMSVITLKIDATLQQLADDTESLISSHSLRLKALQQMLQEGVSHTITSRKRKNERICFAPGTDVLKSESDLINIVQVMVDRDVDQYKKYWNDGAQDRKHKLHAFQNKIRGLWITAAAKLMPPAIDVICVPPSECVTAFSETKNDTEEGEICIGHSTDVSTLGVGLSQFDTCDNCNACTEGLKTCAAIGCEQSYCNHCEAAFHNPTLSHFYCKSCSVRVHRWFQVGENMTAAQLQVMQKQPLNLAYTNDDVNIWHAYKTALLKRLTLLPMSMSPTRVQTDENAILQAVLANNVIPVVTKIDLNNQRQILAQQFKNLKCSTGPVTYHNDAGKTIHLAKVESGHDTSSVSAINEKSRYMLSHIFRRADYHSAIKLMRNSADHSMLSVVSKSRINQGTVIIDYGGIHFLSSQLPDSNIGFATSSITWEVLKHKDAMRDVLLHPCQESNCGRFVNGARADEQHRVNCAIVKVLDDHGCIHVLIVALRDIQPWEHLFYYYGDDYLTEWIHQEKEGEFLTMEEMSKLDWEEVPIASC